MKFPLFLVALVVVCCPLFLRAAGPQGPVIGPCPVFPTDNVWNTAVDRLPPLAASDLFVKTIGAEKGLHADFGSGMYEGHPLGIPFTLIGGDQKRVPIKFMYADDSDLSSYPIPPDAQIEGGAAATDGDRHVVLVDTDNCVLWEIYAAAHREGGAWQGGSGAVFDLKCNCMRPDGKTSADAAGLPIFPGLVRYDEVAAGQIRHA